MATEIQWSPAVKPDFHLDGLAAEILPIVGKRRRALLIVGGGLHQLLVNPERDRDRLGRFRAADPPSTTRTTYSPSTGMRCIAWNAFGMLSPVTSYVAGTVT